MLNSPDSTQSQLDPKCPHRARVAQVEKRLFGYLKLSYKAYDVPAGDGDPIHAVEVPSNSHPQRYFYVSHGFGGSSLLLFKLLDHLLPLGNVVFYEVRGMGLGAKEGRFNSQDLEQIEDYFLQGITAMLNFFKHEKVSVVCHSFSCYLMLLYAVRQPQMTKKYIDKMLLLSPVGLTPAQLDYKRSMRKCSECIEVMLNKIGWFFKLTYKSYLRKLCCCCNTSLIRGGFADYNLSQEELEMMVMVVEAMVALPDGHSEDMFFEWFLPRVISKVSIERQMTEEPAVPIVMAYGGEEDWVDRQGAQNLANKFPKKMKKEECEKGGHSIPFYHKITGELIRKHLS